ncbi:MAG: hypothetical protein ACM3XM_13110 [Mycobacterium leprae]
MRRYLSILAVLLAWELLPRLSLVRPLLLPPTNRPIRTAVRPPCRRFLPASGWRWACRSSSP